MVIHISTTGVVVMADDQINERCIVKMNFDPVNSVGFLKHLVDIPSLCVVKVNYAGITEHLSYLLNEIQNINHLILPQDVGMVIQAVSTRFSFSSRLVFDTKRIEIADSTQKSRWQRLDQLKAL